MLEYSLSLPFNTSIKNTAFIYFDFNPAIKTNTAIAFTPCLPTTAIIYDTICSGTLYVFNGANLTQSGAYKDTLINAKGCDSILTLNLFIKQKTSATKYDTICAGTAYIFNGTNLTQSGSYKDTFINAKGCDSILTLNLVVNGSPALPVISHRGNSLTTPKIISYSYQWLRNTQLIVGAIDTGLVLSQNGDYVVKATAPNSCSKASLSFKVNNVGISDIVEDAAFQLYPNPNKGSFTLVAPHQIGQEWQVLDALGRGIAKGTVQHENEYIQLPEISAGMYILHCGNGQQRMVISP